MTPPETDTQDQSQMTSTGGSAAEQADEAPNLAELGVREGAGHAVHLKDLHAYYGGQHAVKGIDIDFPANQVTAIIGPSGCGKSTMVRCINRMHEEIPGPC
jgi:ABC-type multidrug transport system fused ATPase/permease subunit